MSEIEDLMQDSMDTVEGNKLDGLGRITKLAEEMDGLQSEIRALEDQIKEKQGRVNDIAMDDLPSIMDETGSGLTALELKNGHRLILRAFHSGKIPLEFREQAIEWLDGHGFGDLVKTQVLVKFSMGEFAKAQKLAEGLQKKGLNVGADQSVHTGTLGKWVKEMAEEGRFSEIPEELFTPKTFRKAVIK